MATLLDENEDQEVDTGPIRNPGDIWNSRLSQNKSRSSGETLSEEGNAEFEGIANELQDVEEAGNKIINDNADDPEDSDERRKQLQDDEEEADYRNRVTGPKGLNSNGDFLSRAIEMANSAKAPASVTGIMVAGTMGIATVLGAPAMLFAAIVSQVTNETNYSAAASHVRGLKMLSHRLGGDKESAKIKAACENPKSIRCTSSTMSEKQILELADADINILSGGVDVAEKIKEAAADPDKPVDEKIKIGDRFTAEEMKVPTGDLDKDGKMLKTSIKTGTDIESVLKNNPKMRTKLFKGYNPLTKVFFSSHFNDVLKTSFSTDRGDKLTGDDEKSERQSMREALGIEGVEGDENGRMTPEERERVGQSRVAQIRSSVGKLNQKVTAPAGAVCTALNVARLITAAAKAKRILEVTRVFVVYASEMHRIMDGTSAPQHSTFIGDNITYGEYNPLDSDGNKNRFYRTAATDGEGLHMLLHNSRQQLSEWAQRYAVGGNGAILEIDKAIQTIYRTTPGGKPTVKSVCRYASSLASCIGPQVLGCAAWYAAFVAGAPLIAKAAGPLVERAISELANLDISDDTKGVDLGNIFAFGGELAGGRMAQEVGLRPSTVSTQKQYRVATADTRNQIAMMYRDQAKSAPFDVTNQYSFLGTLASSIYTHGGTASSIFGNISRALAVVPASIDVIGKGTLAGASGMTMEQNEFQPEHMQECQDPALKAIGVDGKPGCTPAFDMSNKALNVDIEENQDFMFDGGYANEETGEPKGDAAKDGSGVAGAIDVALGGVPSSTNAPDDKDPGKKFAMYVKFCARRDQNVQGPYGETMESIETGTDSDELWREAFYCVNAVDDPPRATSALQSGNSSQIVHAFSANNNARTETLAASTTDGPTRLELDHFAAFTMDYGKAGNNTMMDEGGHKQATQQVSGDCSQLAQQLLDNKANVNFQLEEQRTYMEQTARDCTQTLDCGGSVQMSTKLLQLLVKASQNYKITIGSQAAGHDCDNGYHPKGQAVDINGVRKLDQDMQRMTSWDGGDQAIFKEFYEFLEQNSTVPLELGQRTCFSGATPALSKSKLVNDSCNHIHVGVTEH